MGPSRVRQFAPRQVQWPCDRPTPVERLALRQGSGRGTNFSQVLLRCGLRRKNKRSHVPLISH
jgi:hypothetical protein